MKITKAYVMQMKELDTQIKALTATLNGMKDEVKKQATEEGKTEYMWKGIGIQLVTKHSTRMDNKSLKATFPEIWERFSTSSSSVNLLFK